jgi:hypothetical protein
MSSDGNSSTQEHLRISRAREKLGPEAHGHMPPATGAKPIGKELGLILEMSIWQDTLPVPSVYPSVKWG